MMRAITYKAAKAQVPILFSNHIYEDPTAMFTKLVKNSAGGQGPVYMASILVQLSTKNEKSSENPNEEALAISHNVSGVTLGAMTVKNRFVPNFLKTELYLNFKTGLDVNAGLFDMAYSFGVLELKGKQYAVGDRILGKRDEIEKNSEMWDTVIAPELEKVLQEQLCYSNTASVTVDEVIAADDDED